MNRRRALKVLSTAAVGSGLAPGLLAAERAGVADYSGLLMYLRRHERADGGYGWLDQPDSHLTPTFAVIGTYRAIGQLAPRLGPMAEFIREHHPQRHKKPEHELRNFDYEQIQSLLWLDQDVSGFVEKVSRWTEPSTYPKAYERDGLPPFKLEMMALLCREMLGLPREKISGSFKRFVLDRRRENGSFNHTPATDGSDGHVTNTWWGLQGLLALGIPVDRKAQTVEWLQKCQLSSGGFMYQPKAKIGAVDDVAYTWSVVRALELLEARPADTVGCIRFLKSLHEKGGYGDRPGWTPNPLATYYAVDALRALGEAAGYRFEGLEQLKGEPQPAGMKRFTIQLEAPGQGSPSDAVELARMLHIDLWGAKNSAPGWIERAQQIAQTRKVGVTFFVANEEYGTFARLPGLGTYSHISDLFAPAEKTLGNRWRERSRMNGKNFVSNVVSGWNGPMDGCSGNLARTKNSCVWSSMIRSNAAGSRPSARFISATPIF